MNSTSLIILIIFVGICLFICWKVLKPYFIKYDTTVLFTGGLGSGKTLHAVKTAIVLIRKQRFYKYKLPNFAERRIKRPFRYFINICKSKHKFKYLKNTWHLRKTLNEYNNFNDEQANYYFTKTKKGQLKIIKYWKNKPYRQKPMLYSNIPIHFKSRLLSRKREWAKIITPSHIFLLKKARLYSVIVIDEFPQFINQFEWDEELIQDNANEFITFFRHYIQGYLCVTAQSESDIVVQFRRKLNQAIWCFDFKKHLFGLFYTVNMCDIMLSENASTMTQPQIEENTKIKYGLFPPRKTYDTHCYSPRYNEILNKDTTNEEEFNKLKTNRILRAKYYLSPLDRTTTKKQKEKMQEEVKKLERD